MADQTHKVACCPVCGSTALRALVVCGAIQDTDGEWHLEPLVDSDELQDCCRNVNQEMECTNEYCGNPMDPRGVVIPLKGRTEYEFWRQMSNLPEDLKQEELDPEMLTQFQAWSASLIYVPWHGVLDDCIDLYGNKMRE